MFFGIFDKDFITFNKNKIYDIAIVASRFDRNVKNIEFMKNLFNDETLKNYKKICIGKDSEK